MRWLVHVKIVVVTLVSTYPFVALVQSLTKLSDFRPCDDGCVFLRYVGSSSLPSSRVQHFASAEGNGSTATALPGRDRWEFLPRFVYVRNGHPVVSASLWESFGVFEAAFVAVSGPSLFPMSVVTALHEDEDIELCSPVRPPKAESLACSSPEMKGRIVNHLAESVSRYLYLYFGSVLAWAFLKIAQDSALVAGLSQYITIRIGLTSWLAQSLACGFLFAWSLGTIEVFAAKSVVSNTCWACYYQLPTFAVLLAMSTPLLLMYLVLAKLTALVRSIHFGDYLYMVQYDVPFHVVDAATPEDPTASLIRPIPSDARSIRPRDLPFAEMYMLYRVSRMYVKVWGAILWCGIGPLVMGPLFLRLLLMAIAEEWGSSWHLRAVLLLIVTATPLVTARVILPERLHDLQGLFSESVHNSLSLVWRIWHVLHHVFRLGLELTWCSTPVILLPPLISGISSVDVGESISRMWSWSCGGVYILFALKQAHWLLAQRDSQRALQIKVLVNPDGWSSSDWQDLDSRQPTWQLAESVAIAQAFDAGSGEFGIDFDGYIDAQRQRRLEGPARSCHDESHEGLVKAEGSSAA